jgi:hypothetical protein
MDMRMPVMDGIEATCTPPYSDRPILARLPEMRRCGRLCAIDHLFSSFSSHQEFLLNPVTDRAQLFRVQAPCTYFSPLREFQRKRITGLRLWKGQHERQWTHGTRQEDCRTGNFNL